MRTCKGSIGEDSLVARTQVSQCATRAESNACAARGSSRERNVCVHASMDASVDTRVDASADTSIDANFDMSADFSVDARVDASVCASC